MALVPAHDILQDYVYRISLFASINGDGSTGSCECARGYIVDLQVVSQEVDGNKHGSWVKSDDKTGAQPQ